MNIPIILKKKIKERKTLCLHIHGRLTAATVTDGGRKTDNDDDDGE